MLPFQTVLAILMAATVNMALAAPEISAAAMILATTIVDTVVSSGVQHPVVGPRRGADGKFLPLRAINEPTCFDSSTFPNAGKHNSALVPWTALANQTDSEAELAVFNTLTTICNKFSSTIMTRNIQVSHPSRRGPPRTFQSRSFANTHVLFPLRIVHPLRARQPHQRHLRNHRPNDVPGPAGRPRHAREPRLVPGAHEPDRALRLRRLVRGAPPLVLPQKLCVLERPGAAHLGCLPGLHGRTASLSCSGGRVARGARRTSMGLRVWTWAQVAARWRG